MSNSGFSLAAPRRGREPHTDKTILVSTLKRVPTKWVPVRTLQPSIEPVVATSSVPLDLLVDGQVSGLGTVHPFLTSNFCIGIIHLVFFPLLFDPSATVI